MSNLKYILPVLFFLILTSCTKDLDRSPKYGLTADVVYSTEDGYRSALAKIYGGFALTGNNGPDGDGDLGGIDEGFSSYLRNYWNLQELPTDEAVIGWNDQTIKDFHEMDWTPADNFLRAMYSRLFYQITLANAFIREASDEAIAGRGFSGAEAESIAGYRAEARFIRALTYYHALDLFGNTTFVTEEDPIGAFLPPQISRSELFDYIEQECLALEDLLPAPKGNEYGRADQAAVWMLLANMYLNAEVYTGRDRYTDAITYSNKVIGSNQYSLDANYDHLFMADNDQASGIIFPITFDGNATRTWGGTTYLVHAPIGGDMIAGDYGIDNPWGGLRTTKALVEKFPDPSGTTDARANFYTNGQNLDIEDIGNFRDGYAIVKWVNKTSDGAAGSNLTWVDVDFPVFRLAEAYLIYAEAVLRGGTGGTMDQALSYVNLLRERAFGNDSGNVSSIDLPFILDERAREFHWEGKRRTDLIRFGQFTTDSYLWPWKGNAANGRGVEAFRILFPIPAPEINTNPNLNQNTGY
ncbi:MAG: RagB/SusD family nutrient uptake outer membrane protein [Saprospiraceae bacterium]